MKNRTAHSRLSSEVGQANQIDAERLQRIEEIYHAALEISSAARADFFKERCGADEDLRREVEFLLSFEKNFDSFIAESPAALAAEMFSEREKPTIRADGIVKVFDFGIAKLAVPRTDSIETEGETLAEPLTQTKPGMIISTLQYMSPEQVRGQTIDARSDIFSVGVVVYEMLTGNEPFKKSTSSDIIAAILTEQPPPVGQIRSDAPAELERIVGKSLRKNKDERYQTCKDFLIDIRSLGKSFEFQTNPQQSFTDDFKRRTNEQSIQKTHSTPVRRFSITKAFLIFLTVGFAVCAIWWFAAGKNYQAVSISPSTLTTVEIVNWRSTPGELYSVGAFSPDGKMIAFTSTKNGAKNIWVKQISGGEAVQITRDEFVNQNPIWSPNGDEIAFFSTRGGTSGIWRMSSFGGNPTFIKAVEDGGAILRQWSKNDVIYYESMSNVFALDLKSGQIASSIKSNSENIIANTISISPDEKQAAFVTFENEKYTIWTMPMSGGLPKQIINSADEIRNTIWHTDGKRILYSQINNGIFQIYAAHSDGSNPAQITFGDRDAFALDVSADGSKILYGSSKEESDLWGVTVEKGEEFPFAADINSELWATVAPDGKSVAYQSVKNLSQGDKIFNSAILTKPVDSAAPPFQISANGFLPA